MVSIVIDRQRLSHSNHPSHVYGGDNVSSLRRKLQDAPLSFFPPVASWLSPGRSTRSIGMQHVPLIPKRSFKCKKCVEDWTSCKTLLQKDPTAVANASACQWCTGRRLLLKKLKRSSGYVPVVHCGPAESIQNGFQQHCKRN